jgi:hypothetical protein
LHPKNLVLTTPSHVRDTPQVKENKKGLNLKEEEGQMIFQPPSSSK